MTATKHTPAGMRLLEKLMVAETSGRLCTLISNMDGTSAGQGMECPRGDGGFLAAAEKLAREGAVSLVGRRHRRFVIITDAGRAAIEA